MNCENCHRPIGDLETPCVFNDSMVCSECRAKLSRRPGGTLDTSNVGHVIIIAIGVIFVLYILFVVLSANRQANIDNILNGGN